MDSCTGAVPVWLAGIGPKPAVQGVPEYKRALCKVAVAQQFLY